MKNCFYLAVIACALFSAAAGCSSTPSSAKRDEQAKFLYNQTMRLYHIAAGDSTNSEQRVALLDQAAQNYESLARDYSDVPRWAAASLRNLGQIQLERGQLKDALASFEQVGRRYPGEHWEVIQAWKAAGDALWLTRQRGEALLYYRQIVNVYGGKTDQPPMFDSILQVARARLKDAAAP